MVYFCIYTTDDDVILLLLLLLLLVASDAQCLSSVDNSTEWLTTNFGHFSEFAAVPDFYHLNPSFSAVSRDLLPFQTSFRSDVGRF